MTLYEHAFYSVFQERVTYAFEFDVSVDIHSSVSTAHPQVPGPIDGDESGPGAINYSYATRAPSKQV